MRLGDIEVECHSTGGLETWIDLPELKLVVDIGRSPARIVSRPTILFTHAHMDHLGGLPYHCATRALLGMAPPRYILPASEIEAVEALLDAWRRLDKSELRCELMPLAPGEELPPQRGFAIRAFQTVHPVPSQGYAFERVSKKLRPELVGLPETELARRARAGEQLSDPVRSLELAITGDTRIEVVEREEAVRKARVLLLECTFLDDRVTRAKARATGHTHLDEIVERADLFENEVVGLYHFSARYSDDEIRRLLELKLPPSLRQRVVPLLPPAAG